MGIETGFRCSPEQSSVALLLQLAREEASRGCLIIRVQSGFGSGFGQHNVLVGGILLAMHLNPHHRFLLQLPAFLPRTAHVLRRGFRDAKRGVLAGVVFGLAIFAAGCSQPLRGMTGVHVQSMDQEVVLSPHLRTIGYRAIDESTADIYLSDIPPDRLAAADSLADLTGSIIELHMFVNPKPGKTPIETTASSVTIRQVILAGGQIGLYGGGGFLFPNGSPGDSSFGGRIKHGSVRLLASTAGFRDRLGAAEFDAGVKARKDAAATAIMARVFESAVHVATQARSAAAVSKLPDPAEAGER